MPSTKHWHGAPCPSCRKMVPVLPDPGRKKMTFRTHPGEHAVISQECPWCGFPTRFRPEDLRPFDLPMPIEYQDPN